MRLSYQGFLLTNVQYELKNIDSHIDPSENSNGVLRIGDGKVAFQTNRRGQKVAVITVSGTATRTNDEDESSAVQQDLTLKSDFVFRIKLSDGEEFNEKEFRKLIQDHALNFCVIKVQEIVKNITSIDYGSPIIIRDFDIPSEIKIFRQQRKKQPTSSKE